MPVYNAGPYLKEAIQSIIDQTFSDYTLLLINNGSTDNSEEIIKGFEDERIHYVKHETNTGLIATLNEGLMLAKSKYIVRMDADDISLPGRFEKQVAFMEAKPDIDISGAWLSVINTNQIISHPPTNEECKVQLLQNTVLGHPAAILRRESIIKNNLKFDKQALYAEDYKFWADASISGLKLANIPEVLVKYRVHDAQVSTTKTAQQLETVQGIKLWYAQHFFGDLVKNKLKVYANFLNCSINSFAEFIEVRTLIKQLKIENQLKKYFDPLLFENFLDNLLKIASFRIYVLCIDCSVKILWQSLFDKHFYRSTSVFQKAKFTFRSIQKTVF
jgi:glycosyltransferase involved in cell wall biosynthesis